MPRKKTASRHPRPTPPEVEPTAAVIEWARLVETANTPVVWATDPVPAVRFGRLVTETGAPRNLHLATPCRLPNDPTPKGDFEMDA